MHNSNTAGEIGSVRALVADDDSVTRVLIRRLLERSGTSVVGEAANGREAVELCIRTNPHVVVMDVEMPGRDGLWATGELRRRGVDVRVLMLTATDPADRGLGSLSVGADAYLNKTADLSELPAAVSGLAAGKPTVSPELLSALIARTRVRPSVGVGVRPVSSPLTTREWEVLDRLCLGQGVAAMAEEFVLSTDTIRSHIKNLMRKLGVHSRAEAIARAAELRPHQLPETH